VKNKQSVSIFWFRRDLRINDNTALLHALDSNFSVLPIFIFDPHILNLLEEKKDARVEFILQELHKIKKSLEENGTTLEIFHDSPASIFKKLQKEYDIKAVFANRDYEPYAIDRDDGISKLLAEKDIKLRLFKDQVIFEGHEVLTQDEKPYKVFTPFKKTWLDKLHSESFAISDISDFNQFYQQDPAPEVSLEDIGFQASGISFPEKDPNIDIIKRYDEDRNFPAKKGTTRLGIHLRFGTVSIRELVRLAMKQNDVWLNELIWREFYSAILQHFPYVAERSFRKKYEQVPWVNDEKQFTLWCQGKTGFPIVDAGMRELNITGYMHNRVRMITASFLTKHLLIDWRWGEAYFASKLLDYELASNNGGWQWAAGTGTDAQPYFRVFNPESQTKKFDPHMKYIKKWIPELDTPEYPKPMVDHKFARNRAIETYKQAVS